MAKEEKEKKEKVEKEMVIPEGTVVKRDNGEEATVISRKSAEQQNLNRYFLGTPCRNGHVDFRRTKDYACISCVRERMKARRKVRLAEDPDYKAKVAAKRAEKHKERYKNDPEYRAKILAKGKERRLRKKAEKEASSAKSRAEAEAKQA